jgi:hypothetical protein
MVEDVPRPYLGRNELESARAGLRALMDRLAERNDLADDEAMTVAVEEVRAVRASRLDSADP